MTKILIADDEANILMLLEIVLKDLNAEIITAENGEVAVQKAKEHKPDLIMTDVVMPKMNGFEVCRAIRSTEEIAETPIIILSALGDEYNKITGFEEGADDYIIKPFNVEELKARATALLLRHSSKQKAKMIHSDHIQIEENNQKVTKIEENKKQESATNIDIDAITTGNAQIDKNLYGGLPKGSNILITGPIGTGKSSFARSFLETGLKNKEKCLWIAIDDDPKRIRQKMSENLAENVESFENRSYLRFVDAYSWSSLTMPENEKFTINGSLELNQLTGVIADASYEIGQTIQNKKGGRRVIDSISSLLINFDLASTQRFLSQIARTGVAFGGVTTLFIIEEGTVEEKVLNNIKYIMDGVIEFEETEDQRTMRIRHMKWIKHDSSPIVIQKNL
jgi:CheY-like chemotaxis protein